MPRIGYKRQVLDDIWKLIEGLEQVLLLDPYDDWIWDSYVSSMQ